MAAQTIGFAMADRRHFLRRSAAWASAAPALAAASDPAPSGTRGPALPAPPAAGFSAYGQPAPSEQAVQRHSGLNHRGLDTNGAAWTPLEQLEGTLTPNGLHFVRNHGGTPAIAPERHTLTLHGLLKQPLRWTVEALARCPQQSVQAFLECAGNSSAMWFEEPVQRPAGLVHGLLSQAEWTGVPLHLLLDEAGVDPAASWLVATGADAGAMHVSLPMALARARGLVALWQNGERLRPENGYPLRLVLPGAKGVWWVKWLTELQAADQPAMARNDTARYTELLADGRARQFTALMDVKSLITSPSHGQHLPGAGLHELRGLAWSGHGAITRVEWSTDGGMRWTDAVLQGPVRPMALTRFRAPWAWDGRPAVLQSRATDSSGQVQPTRAALVAQRGRRGFYHCNAIVSWEVAASGAVLHTYA